MFHLECLIYVLILLYSLFYQIKSILLYKKYKKKDLKNASGLFISKDLLNNNNLGTLYVTKVADRYNDHYDIERNVIRLSDDVYEQENLSSCCIGLYEAIKAIMFNKLKNRKEEKIKHLIMDYANKISFILFIIAAASKAIDVMTLCIIVLIVIIIIKYSYINKKIDIYNENINYIKKEYKLKKEEVSEIEKFLKTLIYNDLSLHILNNKY